MEKSKKMPLLLVLMMLTVMMLSACGSSGKAPTPAANASADHGAGESSNSVESANGSAQHGPVDWEARKKLNEAAGEITYITGYYYAASPPDIEVVMAQELGYFKELGLNVKIMPGLDSEGMKFLAAGQAQIASAGTPSLVIQSVSNGADIKGIATFGSTGTSAIMVMSDSGLKEPKDLVGKMLGYHGAMPANVVAMFKNSGVDPAEVKGVSVGYDPTVLSSGQVDALTVYKSNEPYLMQQMGVEVSIIDPGQFGAETSFGVLTVNNKFAEAHPTAVEDFLRAVSRAHDYAASHGEEALKVMASKSDSVYDLPTETNRWSVEINLVRQSRIPGHGVAWQAEEQWSREIEMLSLAGVIKEQLPVDQVMNNAYIDSIYDGEMLIWPE